MTVPWWFLYASGAGTIVDFVSPLPASRMTSSMFCHTPKSASAGVTMPEISKYRSFQIRKSFDSRLCSDGWRLGDDTSLYCVPMPFSCMARLYADITSGEGC